MLVAAITAKAAPATASAPSMNQRILRRILSDSVMALRLPQPREQHDAVDQESERGDRVRGDHVPPPSDDDSFAHASSPASPAMGGAAISCSSRRAATIVRSTTKPKLRQRTPNALRRSGRWNCDETVCGVDCCWCSEFLHLTEK